MVSGPIGQHTSDAQGGLVLDTLPDFFSIGIWRRVHVAPTSRCLPDTECYQLAKQSGWHAASAEVSCQTKEISGVRVVHPQVYAKPPAVLPSAPEPLDLPSRFSGPDR